MKVKDIILGLAAAAAYAACGGEKVIKSGDTLVFMGDSITEFGKNRTHGYVNLVVKGLAANNINPTWYGVGIQGNTAAQMLARFDNDVISKNPTVVTISAGVNDTYQNIPYATFRQNELDMIAKAKAAGAKVVMLSPTTHGYRPEDCVTDELHAYVTGVKQIAADEGVYYAPTHEMFQAWERDLDSPMLTSGRRETCDGIHMSPAGDRQMARAVLKSFGLGMDELAAAEAAWNADETLVPLIAPPASTATISVNLTAAEAQAVAGLTLKQIIDRGAPSLAANPTREVEGSGASNTMTVTPTSCNFTFKVYDQLIIAARALGITVEEAVKCAILRGARNSDALSPRGPISMVNDVLVGSDRATFDATIESVGATASACDVLLRYGTSADSLGSAERVAVGENASFHVVLKGLQPNTTYFYEATFVNNATTPKTSVVSGSFKTKASSGAIQPQGGFESDTAAIQAAIDAAAPSHGTVTLGEGCFNIDAELMVTGGVSLVGQGWRKTVLQQTVAHRVAMVKDESRIEGVTLTGGYTTEKWTHGSGANVANGTISRCNIHHNQAKGNNVYGVGVYFEKGSIDHSIVAFNTGTDTGAGGGIGHYNAAGTVVIDTCLVYGNVRTNGRGGGVAFVMNNPNVTIRNTTIVGNTASSTGGGFADETYNHKAKLVNCIVSGNTAGSGDADVAGTIASDSSNNLLGGSPAFVEAADHEYHLSANSPAKGAGVAYDGIGTDLDGGSFATPPSIGCYEFDGSLPPSPPVKRPRVVFSVD